MSKLFLLVAFALLSNTNLFAQKISFVDTSNHWIYKIQSVLGPGPFQSPVHYKYSGNKISYRGYDWVLMDTGGDSALIREDQAGKIYARVYKFEGQYTGDTAEAVVYDYTLLPGDTFHVSNPLINYSLVVDKLDSVLINGVYHRTWSFLRLNNFMGTPRMVEGVGSPLIRPLYFYTAASAEYGPDLICFRNRGLAIDGHGVGNCVLSVADSPTLPIITISPQPAIERANIHFGQTIDNGSFILVDILGQTVISSVLKKQNAHTVFHPGVAGVYVFYIRDKNTGFLYKGKIEFI